MMNKFRKLINKGDWVCEYEDRQGYPASIRCDNEAIFVRSDIKDNYGCDSQGCPHYLCLEHWADYMKFTIREAIFGAPKKAS